MENRQKNYGSVHDTKASMMYNRFLKQYNEWLSGGPIPDRIPHGAEKYDIFQGWTDHRKIPEERDLIPDDHLRE